VDGLLLGRLSSTWGVIVRLASFNVENLFARAKALDTTTWVEGEPALAAFDRFNTIAAKPEYSGQDKSDLLAQLLILQVLIPTQNGARLNPNPFDAWALLRENRGDFLVAPNNAVPRIVATGRADWSGWVELITEPVDEVGIRMTARVITDVAADVICLVEAENRPALVDFNTEMLGGHYGHGMLIDGNDPRGIDVGMYCLPEVDIVWMRSHVDDPDPQRPGRTLFSRDCPVYRLRLVTGAELYVLPNHLKSQSFSSGNPDPLRSRQALQVRAIYDQLIADGATLVAVLGDLNKGPDTANPTHHPTLEPLLDPGTPLVSAFDLPGFDVGPRPGTFQSCSLRNRLDYILLSPDLAAAATGGGVFRRGLWGNPSNLNKPQDWEIYPEITAGLHAASDHAAIFVDLDI
jgi:endonuclease/exonuclease/phosphatase family metal-dependent hydrolase